MTLQFFTTEKTDTFGGQVSRSLLKEIFILRSLMLSVWISYRFDKHIHHIMMWLFTQTIYYDVVLHVWKRVAYASTIFIASPKRICD
jgi:hypothetical protein